MYSPFEIVGELLSAALLRSREAVVTAMRNVQDIARPYSQPLSG
jgi:hypothetical protein